MRIVAFTGPKGCGKDTAAKALFLLNEKYQANLFLHLMMAGPAKHIARIAFDLSEEDIEDRVLKEKVMERFPFECPRQLVIDVANWYRAQYGGHVWAINWERRAQAREDRWGCFVQTDLRFPEEVEMLRRHKALIIYVDRKEAEASLAIKQAAGDKMATNVSERHYTYLKTMANAVIDNNGTVEHLDAQVHAVVQNGLGHWKYWDGMDQYKAWFEKNRIASHDHSIVEGVPAYVNA